MPVLKRHSVSEATNLSVYILMLLSHKMINWLRKEYINLEGNEELNSLFSMFGASKMS